MANATAAQPELEMDADVIIVGAGPTGLMLATELRLLGVQPVVVERQPQPRETPRANGIGGQILHLLAYRGLSARLRAASTDPSPAPRFPFGGVHLDLASLADPPLDAVQIPQPRLEGLLAERAGELGADIRRGHEVLEVTQDETTVVAHVLGPDGPYRLAARYLVGCDGPRSRVRDLAGISFPGITYPEVNRLGQVIRPDSVTLHDNGDLDVPGYGRIRSGFTRTDRGVFAFGTLTPESLFLNTIEDEATEYDEAQPLTLVELQDSIRRVLGADIPLGEPIRLSRYTYQARQAEQYRNDRVLLAGDAAHLFPATGVALNAGLLDAVNLAWKLAAAVQDWAPAGLLDTYHDERHLAGVRTLQHTQAQVALRRGTDPAAEALRGIFQELLFDEQARRRIAALIAGADIRYPPPTRDDHPMTGIFLPDLPLRTDQGTGSVAELMHDGRPILLDLASRADIREAAQDWRHRIGILAAETDHRPADALLVRPDAHIAWAATIGEPVDSAASSLRKALSRWFGPPRKTGGGASASGEVNPRSRGNR